MTNICLEFGKLQPAAVKVNHLGAFALVVCLVAVRTGHDGGGVCFLYFEQISRALQVVLCCVSFLFFSFLFSLQSWGWCCRCKTNLAHFAFPDEVRLASASRDFIRLLEGC